MRTIVDLKTYAHITVHHIQTCVLPGQGCKGCCLHPCFVSRCSPVVLLLSQAYIVVHVDHCRCEKIPLFRLEALCVLCGMAHLSPAPAAPSQESCTAWTGSSRQQKLSLEKGSLYEPCGIHFGVWSLESAAGWTCADAGPCCCLRLLHCPG